MVGTQRSVVICAEKPFDKVIGAGASWGAVSHVAEPGSNLLCISLPPSPSASIVGMCTMPGVPEKFLDSFILAF